MVLTDTVHPPAGATSLLAVTNSQIVGLGWFLFPMMILGVILMQAAALLINNIHRRFPLYWWTSRPLARAQNQDVEIQEKEALSLPSQDEDSMNEPRQLVVGRSEILVPIGVYLTPMERGILERIQQRI